MPNFDDRNSHGPNANRPSLPTAIRALEDYRSGFALFPPESKVLAVILEEGSSADHYDLLVAACEEREAEIPGLPLNEVLSELYLDYPSLRGTIEDTLALHEPLSDGGDGELFAHLYFPHLKRLAEPGITANSMVPARFRPSPDFFKGWGWKFGALSDDLSLVEVELPEGWSAASFEDATLFFDDSDEPFAVVTAPDEDGFGECSLHELTVELVPYEIIFTGLGEPEHYHPVEVVPLQWHNLLAENQWKWFRVSEKDYEDYFARVRGRAGVIEVSFAYEPPQTISQERYSGSFAVRPLTEKEADLLSRSLECFYEAVNDKIGGGEDGVEIELRQTLRTEATTVGLDESISHRRGLEDLLEVDLGDNDVELQHIQPAAHDRASQEQIWRAFWLSEVERFLERGQGYEQAQGR